MTPSERSAQRQRRPKTGPSDLVRASLVLLAGSAVLVTLLVVSRMTQLDALLLISKAIFNVFTGIKQIGAGVMLLLLGLAQSFGLLALSLAALLSVLAVTSGLVRLLSRALPGFAGLWGVFARLLNGVIALLGVPLPEQRSGSRGQAGRVRGLPSDLATRAALQMRRAG